MSADDDAGDLERTAAPAREQGGPPSADAAPPLVDAEARTAIREDLDVSMVVEAAAGTGKTTLLVDRLVALIATGRATIDSIAAVTFTERAAGELTLRLRQALERARDEARPASDDAEGAARAARLAAALGSLELASIGTLHALAADLLRERPLDAGVSPAFTVLAEDEAHALVARAIDERLPGCLDAEDGALRRLRRRSVARGDDARAAVEDAVRALLEHRDALDAPPPPPFDRAAAIEQIGATLESLAALLALAERATDPLVEALAPVAAWVEARRRRAARGGVDPIARQDEDEADLVALASDRGWTSRGRGGRFGAGISRADALARRDAARAALDAFVAAADADLAARLPLALAPIASRYEELKRRRGALDFLDLLLTTRRLLTARADARAALATRYSHVFVDEFQDTDPCQADLVRLLTADDPAEADPARVRPRPGALFVVGDPKQSIYRFRRADLGAYRALVEGLVAAGARRLELTTSFRAGPEIQRVVNVAFGAAMDGREGQAGHVPLAPHRAPTATRPSVVALGIPAPYDGGPRPSKRAIEASTPRAVGAFVVWLVQRSGWTVRDPASGLEAALTPAHVCLLFRRTRGWDGADVVGPYVRALEAQGVSHTWLGGSAFAARHEVRALVALAEALDDPDDATAVYAVLRGPFVALEDAALLRFFDRLGSLHPMRRHDPSTLDPALAPVATALALLRSLHVERNRRPIAETLRRFLDETGALTSLAMRRGGGACVASVSHVLAIARRADAREHTFRAFVEGLPAALARGARGVDDDGLDGPRDGVRVMTVHGAKGLEFPVVVLCDPTATGRGYADRHVDPTTGRVSLSLARMAPAALRAHEARATDASAAEIVRLAYVGSTRARDVLVIPACGDGPVEGGWLSALDRAIYPSRAAWRQGEGRAPGCPTFGDDSVQTRSFEAMQAGVESVRPGLHRDLGVVWWDPSRLRLDEGLIEGLRAPELMRRASDEEKARAEAGRAAWQAWADARARAVASGASPSQPWSPLERVARRLDADAGSASVEVRRVAAPGAASLSSSPRAEALFRAALAEVDPRDDRASIEALVVALPGAARVDPSLRGAIVETLLALAREPLWAESEGASRAVPCVARDARGVLVEGRIDLVATREGVRRACRVALGGASLAEAESSAARHLARALEEATGASTRPTVIWLAAP